MSQEGNDAPLDIFAGGEEQEDMNDDLGTLDRGDSFEDGDPIPEEDIQEEEDFEDDPTPEPEPDEEEDPEPDEEEDPEPDEEEDPEPDEEEDPEPTPKQRIPKARFDEVNNRRKNAEERAKQLEEELARMKGEDKDVEQFDFDNKEQEYMEAVVDGEFEKAKAIRAEIRHAEQTEFKRVADTSKAEAVSQTQVEIDFHKTIRELETEYPEFNSKGDAVDEVAISEALDLHEAYLMSGKYGDPSDSLRAATELIALKYGYNNDGEADADPEPAPKPKGKRGKSVKAKAKIANDQPGIPESGTPGIPSDGPTIDDMSEEEFDALPESKKREMRGDVV